MSEMGIQLSTVDLGLDFVVKSVHSGYDQRCALSTDGRLKCWGNALSGALANGASNAFGYDIGDAVEFSLGSNVSVLSSGDGLSTHHCAMVMEATPPTVSLSLYCWGSNIEGQLGAGDRHMRSTPVKPAIQINIVTGAPTAQRTSLPTLSLGTTTTPAPPTPVPTTPDPTTEPSASPSLRPTVNPSGVPSFAPSGEPSRSPSELETLTTSTTSLTTAPTLAPAASVVAAAPTLDMDNEEREQETSTTDEVIQDDVGTASKESQDFAGQEWLLVIGALLVVMCVLTSSAVCVTCYRSRKRALQQQAEQNISSVVNMEMQDGQKQGRVAEPVVELEAETEVHESEPSMQREGSQVASGGDAQTEGADAGPTVETAGIMASAQTARNDKERMEKGEVLDWLKKTVRLEQYYANFWENGYASLAFIKHISSREELVEIGITKLGHQLHLVKSIQKL